MSLTKMMSEMIDASKMLVSIVVELIRLRSAIDRSIEELRNRVVVVNQGEKSMKVLAQADAKNSQRHYGIMQKNESADDKTTIIKAKGQAENLLKQLNKQTSTKTVTLISQRERGAFERIG